MQKGYGVSGLNQWIIENPMVIHIPIAFWVAGFSLLWICFVLRFGRAGAARRLHKRRVVFLVTLVAVSVWGIYGSLLFEKAPILWL